MLIEIHMLQNHAPSNLNRDDTGSPKDCLFGGIRRARISSQCLKRSIRRSQLLADDLANLPMGQRTRRLPTLVRERLLQRGLADDLADVAALKATGFGNKDGKEAKDEKKSETDGDKEVKLRTRQAMFLTDADIEAITDVLHNAATEAGTAKKFEKVAAKELQAKAELKGWRPITLDIALFGRMITSDAFMDVEAAMQVAHAISTNKVDHEFDYFTAVDDLQKRGEDDDASGADMIGDVEYNSACYYKYFSLDTDQLLSNLAGPDATRKDEALETARLAIPAFVKAATFTTPSGKQNTFAAHQLPAAILVEVRSRPTPVSYANAFVAPVNSRVNLVAGSEDALVAHVDRLTQKFSLQAKPRLWFSTDDHDAPKNTDAAPVTVCPTLDDLLNHLRDLL